MSAVAVLLLLHLLALWPNVLDRAISSEATHTTAVQRLELLRTLCGDSAQNDGCVVLIFRAIICNWRNSAVI